MAGSGSMIRAPLRGNVGACLGIIETASRFGIAPFALAAKAYLVNDNIAYESQAINAMIYATGYLEGRLKYRFEGEGDNLKVTVTGRIKGEPEVLELETPLKRDIKPQNSPLWKNDPQMQIGYYGSRAWCRRHAPDLLMGIYDVDEFERGLVNVTPEKSEDPAAKLSASIERSSQERAEAEAAKAKEPAPADPEPQDAEFEEAKPAATEAEVVEAMREELEREPEPESAVPQGDLLGDEPATDANGAKLKKEPATGQSSAAKAVEEAEDAATSPSVKQPPAKLIETAQGAEAWAESFSVWYKSLTKAERKSIGGTFDKLADKASKITDRAMDIITDANNSPAADEEV